jgi:hypothetical protein
MDMLIGGKWAPAVSGSREEITSPFDGAASVVPAVVRPRPTCPSTTRSGQWRAWTGTKGKKAHA